MKIPKRCLKCIHCTDKPNGDVITPDWAEGVDPHYCDFIDYYNEYGCPVPYPYFYREEKECRGYKERKE